MMADESRTGGDPPPAGPAADMDVEIDASQQGDRPGAARPYLQVFGPDTGVFEYCLPYGSVTIGRSDHADIWLPHHTVSRVHATITLDNNEYILEDANSNYGTTVNNKRVEAHILRHGDSIQISFYVLQFRTHPALPGATEAAARARVLLRSKFCLLPSTMRLRYRTLEVAPREIFRPGDTLRIGHGGLLLPATIVPSVVCLELHLVWPNDHYKRYLGEIMGVIPQGSADWMCVKLHSVAKEVHDVVVSAVPCGPWVEVPST
jgi:hypothetical protein